MPPNRIPPALLMQYAPTAPIIDLTTPMRPVPPVGDGGTDAGYWYGHNPPAERRSQGLVDINPPVYPLPVMAQIPRSDGPQDPVWFNTNCPPWVCPPYWSEPIDQELTACIPWYEVDTLMGTIAVPGDRFYVIRQVSYEALNAAQDDVFEFSILVNNKLVARWEDIAIDVAQPNPANKFGLSGHTRPLPLWFIADRSQHISVFARLRGAINLAGVSPNFPGQPIITGNCHMSIALQGWLANLRENRDGGPRPTDLGNMGNLAVFDDQGGGQAS